MSHWLLCQIGRATFIMFFIAEHYFLLSSGKQPGDLTGGSTFTRLTGLFIMFLGKVHDCFFSSPPFYTFRLYVHARGLNYVRWRLLHRCKQTEMKLFCNESHRCGRGRQQCVLSLLLMFIANKRPHKKVCVCVQCVRTALGCEHNRQTEEGGGSSWV